MDVTISVHVYSLQRAELKDSAPLYSTDYDALKENMKNCNKYVVMKTRNTTKVCTIHVAEQICKLLIFFWSSGTVQ